MEISAKELRGKPSQIIDQAARGTEVVITVRGKKMARLIPYKAEGEKKAPRDIDDDIFGLWSDEKDRPSVEEYVRSLRKRRSF
jgi:prevent-host-death family protein